MKKLITSTAVFLLCTALSMGQELTQTIRGTVTDVESKAPLIGASIVIAGSDPIKGAVTDLEGRFRLENVPIGRADLMLSYMGYESKIVPNIEVNSGKENVLDLVMQESLVKMEEVVITAERDKGVAVNEMSLLSARSLDTEQNKRFSGGFNDPSRVVTNYAGVTFSPDGGSDIIVRGNAPKYVQWRLEGMEITSPYHFNDQNASGGALSALNNNLLGRSDFYTGAFSPEYGNVLSSVMDMRLRPGNNEKFEAAVGVGLIGTDITFEGPFKKGYGGSFLINYRYSTAGLISKAGLVNFDMEVMFQDLNAKVVLPTKKAGTFSLFTLGGLSGMTMNDLQADFMPLGTSLTRKTNVQEDLYKDNHMLNVGLGHEYNINDHSFLKTTVVWSGSGISDELYHARTIETYDAQGTYIGDSTVSRRLYFQSNMTKPEYRAAVVYHNKINAKNKIQVGTRYALFNYDFKQSQVENHGPLLAVVDFNENVSTVQNFISWKHRFSDKVTLVSGLHNMNVLLNNESTIEPRVALNWMLNESNSFHIGYGNHSTMESIHHYFSKVQQPDGSMLEANKDLKPLRAHHYVAGYEKRFTDNLMLKAETYYQDLYNISVENDVTSYFSTINEGLQYQYVDLVNEGTGKNYGIELSLQRFFDNNYYFMINGALYDSKFTTLEDIERHTRYSSGALANILAGKEIHGLGKKDNQTLGINVKALLIGGQRYVPLLRDEAGNLDVDPANNLFWDNARAYEARMEDLYQVNLSVSYKFNRKKTTHELFLDIQNITGTQGKIMEYYDENKPGNVAYLTQFGLFPNFMYRVFF